MMTLCVCPWRKLTRGTQQANTGLSLDALLAAYWADHHACEKLGGKAVPGVITVNHFFICLYMLEYWEQFSVMYNEGVVGLNAVYKAKGC